MANIGVVRKLDVNGRIQIPMDIREKLNFLNNEELNVYMKDNKVVIEKCRNYTFCHICGREFTDLSDVVICPKCKERWGSTNA